MTQDTRQEKVYMGVQELRYGLEQAGWIPPHSFVLTNPDENNPRKRIRSLWYATDIPWEAPLSLIQKMAPEDVLQKQREGVYYVQIGEGSDRPFYRGMVSEQLYHAVLSGHTEVASVGRSFPNIWFLVNRRKAFWSPKNLNLREWDSFMATHPVECEWTAGQWHLHCQGLGQHLALVHLDGQGAEDRAIQYDDDPYLVHIAESYLLFLCYREMLPEARRNVHTPENYGELGTLDATSLPESGTFACPIWLTDIIERGYY